MSKMATTAKKLLQLAALMGCHYFDANTVVTENNHSDYKHLTREGHKELASALTERIPGLLSD